MPRFASFSLHENLLNKGYSNFSLEILEYLEPSDAKTREQYYLDLFAESPKYNILPIAGSSLGYKHSEESLLKMSFVRFLRHKETFKTCGAREAQKGRTLSQETKAKMGEAKKGVNHPRFGKNHFHSEETKAKISFASRPRQGALR